MTVCRRLTVDRSAKIKVLDDSRRSEIEALAYSLRDRRFVYLTRSEGVDHYRHGLRNADSVRELNLALICKSCRNDVLCNVSCRVGCRTVDLRRILARESSAAVTGVSAVGVNDDLSAGKSGVTCRTANDKSAGGVYVDLGLCIHKLSRNDSLDDELDHILADLCELNVSRVLSGDYNGVNANGLAVVILNSHLSLSVGTEIVECTVLSYVGKSLCELVRERDRQRHKLLGLVASVSEHKSLIACTDIELVSVALLRLKRLVNAHRDVGRLLVNRAEHAAAIAVKAVLCSGVADLADCVSYDLLKINDSLGRDLTHNCYKSCRAEGLARNARHRVLLKQSVEYRIRNFIRYFIGMSFGYRFGRKKHFLHSFSFLSSKNLREPRRSYFLIFRN